MTSMLFNPKQSRKWQVLALLMAAFAVLAFSAAPAMAESTEKRLKRLEADVEGLSRLLLEGKAAPRGGAGQLPSAGGNQAVADMQVRLSRLEQQIMILSGQIEKLAFENRQLASRLARQSDDNEFRMRAIEDRLNGGAAAAPAGDGGRLSPGSTPAGTTGSNAQSGTKATTVSLPAGSTKDQYAYALRLLRDGSYDQAGQAFQQFIDKHPRDGLVGNAQYWLGETHYAKGEFREAAAAFLVGVQKYKKGTKAPDSMLKLGMSTRRLGHIEQACLILDELPSRFPKANSQTKQTAKAEIAQIGCGAYLN